MIKSDDPISSGVTRINRIRSFLYHLIALKYMWPVYAMYGFAVLFHRAPVTCRFIQEDITDSCANSAFNIIIAVVICLWIYILKRTVSAYRHKHYPLAAAYTVQLVLAVALVPLAVLLSFYVWWYYVVGKAD